ncbi:MAG: tripartite tricarboxylate transporter TctB family protein [Burkholderiales bacterium]|nr:tripartite tricarboxylate transporter TctB family protein [Burkholderiales bacterium]
MMISRHAQENLASVLLLAFFAGVIWMCQDFGPRARMIPQPLAIFGIVLTLIQMAWHNFGSPAELRMDMISVQAPDIPVAEAQAAPEKKSSWRREAAAYGMIGVLLALTFITGVLPAAFLFTAGYFMVTRYCSWQRSLIYAAVLTASLYLLFVAALQMQPYHGLLAPLFQ